MAAVSTITVARGDMRTARHTAAAWLRGPQRGLDPGLGRRPRAAWVGTPSTLGGLAVHEETEVTVSRLATILEGGDAAGGKQVRGPATEAVSHRVVQAAPDWVFHAWRDATPERRKEIENALIASAGDMLEHIRQTMPVTGRRLSDREVVPAIAHGIAASAVVHHAQATGTDEDRSPPRLIVDVLLVGVEDFSGKLHPPDLSAIDKDDLGAEAAAVAQGALIDRLERLGYAVDGREGDTSPPRVPLIGRRSVVVADPFTLQRRQLVGEEHATRLDEEATLLGEEIAELPDHELEEAGAAVGLPFASLRVEHAIMLRDLDRRIEQATLLTLRAQEDLVIVGARARQAEPGNRLLTALTAQSELTSQRLDVRRELTADKPIQPGDPGRLHAWVRDEWAPSGWRQTVYAIAVQRELALRERERRELPGVGGERAASERTTPAGALEAKQIGCGQAMASAGERRSSDSGSQGLDFAEMTITRESVSLRKALDQLRVPFGDERVDRLAPQAAALATWAKSVPDSYLALRRHELRRPAFDPGVGCKVVVNEAAQRHVTASQLEAAEAASSFDAVALHAVPGSDEQRRHQAQADAAHQKVIDSERDLERLKAVGISFLAERDHPDTVLARSGRDLLAWSVYADEHAIRRELGILRETERSLEDPSDIVAKEIGSRPEELGFEHDEWVTIARTLEYERLTTEADLEEGIDRRQRERDPEVEKRIDLLRAVRGMPPREHGRSRDRSSGLDFDG